MIIILVFALLSPSAWWCPGHGGGSFYCTGR
jgi:hypothetical protein